MTTPNDGKPRHLRAVTGETRKVAHATHAEARLEPGDRLAGTDLQVVKVLGTGGFGVVYECQDTELDIPVAVKLLTAAATASPEALSVFREESRALAKISSPHVVAVRRFGQTREPIPRPYIVMEKLAGNTLLDALSNYGRFDQMDTVVYGIHMATGLAAAHHAGLIHRDVKPANVFLCRGIDPVTGKVITVAKLLDFGIARTASSGAPDSARLPIICSHPYCGPEQYYGRAFPQTDLYALAVVMYLMLTREHPLGTLVSDRDWVRAKLSDRPRPLRLNQTIDELNQFRSKRKAPIPRVDPELEDLLDRCLSYEPEDRPGTAEAVVRQLEVVLERLNAAQEAKDDAQRRQKGLKPARGAATVPEPPTWMQKRVTEEYERSRQAVPLDEPETVQSMREVQSQLERSRAIELAIVGMTPDHPALTDAEVTALRGTWEEAPRLAPGGSKEISHRVGQDLILAGSTLESPQAAQRNARKWSTSGARVIMAPDKTPVMEGLPQMADLAPPDHDYAHRQKRGFTVANQALVELPVTGPWRWKAWAANVIERHVYHPEKGTHWRTVVVVVPLAAALTILVVAAVVRVQRAWSTPAAEPAAASTTIASPQPTASMPPAAHGDPASTALPKAEPTPGAMSEVAPPAAVRAPAAHAASHAGSTAGTKSGPSTPEPATPSAPVMPATSPTPSPAVSLKHWALIQEPDASPIAPKPAAPSDITPNMN